VIVYFVVFGAGVFYLLRLMRRPPAVAEPGMEHIPIRTAGITPAPALEPDPAE
jgi:cytochrome d ubiquinol oxidase subunit I